MLEWIKILGAVGIEETCFTVRRVLIFKGPIMELWNEYLSIPEILMLKPYSLGVMVWVIGAFERNIGLEEVMKIRLLWIELESFQVSQENLLLLLALCLVRIHQVNSLHPGRGPSVELKQVVTPMYDFHLTQLWEIISVLNKSPIQPE